jgi:hypothetical protein
MVQQTQPLLIWMICSFVSATRMSLSMFSSPNSFSMTAIFWPCDSVSTRLSSVVLPLPRKPVRMVAGIRPWLMVLASLVTDRVISGSQTVFQALHPVKRAAEVFSASRDFRHRHVSDPQPSRFVRAGAGPSPQDPPDESEKRSLFERLIEFLSRGPDSKAELIRTLADAEQRELIEPESRLMLEGVLRMADMSAGDVMVAAPRMDLLDIDAPYDELLKG